MKKSQREAEKLIEIEKKKAEREAKKAKGGTETREILTKYGKRKVGKTKLKATVPK